MRGARRLLAVPLVMLAAAACAVAPAPQDHFYRLRSETPTPRARPALPGVLEVDRLRGEGLTGERGLLYSLREDPVQVHRYAYHQWSEAPGAMLQDVVAAYLRAANVAATVVTPDLRAPASYRLTGRIERLEQVLGGEAPVALIELELALLRAGSNELLLAATYRAERTAAGPDVAASVEAMSDALGELLERFVADVARASGGPAFAGAGP